MAVFLAGVIAGGMIAGWLVYSLYRNKIREIENELATTAENYHNEHVLRERLETELAIEKKTAGEKLELIKASEQALAATFKSLSAEALQSSSVQFLELAKSELGKIKAEAKGELDLKQEAVNNLIKPISESLDKYERQLREIEENRNRAYGSITEQVSSLKDTQTMLHKETARLVDALRKPHVRGHWGEMQLRQIVEFAGMQEYCDFAVQESVDTVDGKLRPDLVVRVPGGRKLIVDSKAPMNAYFDAVNCTDEAQKKTLLQTHARNVRTHLNDLSSKEYWKRLESPDFVIMFIPGEPFYLAALQEDPSLISAGIENRVIIASPTTLITLLRVSAYGWRQEKLAQSAREISKLGREFHERISTLAEHFSTLGRNLEGSVKAYNRTIGTLESRVLTTARKFQEYGIETAKEISEFEPLETAVRELKKPEGN